MRKNLYWFVFGISIGLVLCIGVAYLFGPRGSTTRMNLYTGATWTDHHLLWHSWRTEDPIAKHTEWANSHITTKQKYWPVFVSEADRRWFGGTIVGDGFPRNIVRELYELPITKEEKIELLHEYHKDISTVVAVSSKDVYRELYKMWDEKLKMGLLAF